MGNIFDGDALFALTYSIKLPIRGSHMGQMQLLSLVLPGTNVRDRSLITGRGDGYKTAKGGGASQVVLLQKGRGGKN